MRPSVTRISVGIGAALAALLALGGALWTSRTTHGQATAHRRSSARSPAVP